MDYLNENIKVTPKYPFHVMNFKKFQCYIKALKLSYIKHDCDN